MALKTRILLAVAAVIILFAVCGCEQAADIPLDEKEQNIQSDSYEKESTNDGLQLVPDSGTYSEFG